MKNVSVIGTGTMGNGIAHVFAQKGFKVSLVGISDELVQKAIGIIGSNLERQVNKGVISEEDKLNTLNNLIGYTDLKGGVQDADLVVEAVFEDVEAKKEIFRSLSDLTPAHTILASNTSSLSITRLASFTKRPEQVIGMHFMNPVPVMRLVEVIKGYLTSQETSARIMECTQMLDKIPVVVNDHPGFVANRILMPMINEAIYTLFEGVAGVEEIDMVMKLGMSHPMGPLQLADFIGLDVCLAIMNVLYNDLKNPKYAPCPLLVKMVEAGTLGAKTGRGFYKHEKGSKELVVSERFKSSRS